MTLARVLAILSILWVGVLPTPARAAVTLFIDEASYLAAILSAGYVSVHEGFEGDAPWGSVRTVAGVPKTAHSITNLGITWTGNNALSAVTTSGGAAHSGSWGFYELPHGNPPAIGDGFIGSSATPIYGVAGWFRTSTPPAALTLWLDRGAASERQVVLGDLPGTGFVFLGVIDPDGFSRFEYGETEFATDPLKYVFADDFTFATQAAPVPALPDLARGLLIVLALVLVVSRIRTRHRAAQG